LLDLLLFESAFIASIDSSICQLWFCWVVMYSTVTFIMLQTLSILKNTVILNFLFIKETYKHILGVFLIVSSTPCGV